MTIRERMRKEYKDSVTIEDFTFAGEEWKPVVGYEKEYLVSSMGRVFSNRRKIIMCPVEVGDGYLAINISVNGKHKCGKIHRLVAEAFIKNPENKMTVNHINEIKTDNRVENLEWATMREQNMHGTKRTRARSHMDYKAISAKFDHKEAAKSLRKPIAKLNEKNEIIGTYLSINDAARDNNINVSHISACARGKRKHCGGYRWKWL